MAAHTSRRASTPHKTTSRQSDCLSVLLWLSFPASPVLLLCVRFGAVNALYVLGAGFQHHIEGRFGGTTHAAESTRRDHLTQLPFTRLGAEGRPGFLGQ